MNLDFLLTMVKMEVRLRMRRLGTMIALLIVIGVTWAMVSRPSAGMSMMVVDRARTLYTSSTLALGSVTLSSGLLAMIGFYLVRGRVVEDIRSGIGGVIAATEVSNLQFLIARWLGGVAYLGAIGLTVMLTMMVRHLIDGVGPLQPLIYLQTYALILTPLIFFSVSFAILFDSFQVLMGKFGDVAYFFVFCAFIGIIAPNIENMSVAGSPLLALDFFGIGTTIIITKMHFHSHFVSVGGSNFDPALAPRVLPDMVWWTMPVLYRLASACLALLPLIPAVLRFHRFSPDRIKASAGNKRRSPLAILNQILRPLSFLVQPVFALAIRTPGKAGEVFAELGLCLISSPIAILSIIGLNIAAMLMPGQQMSGVLIAAVAIWMILISDMATRDYQADSENMSGATASGTSGRYSRQLATALLLGSLMMVGVASRGIALGLLSLPALLSGVFMLASFATLLGRFTRTSRAFTVLSLFWVYVAVQIRSVSWIDVVGFNGVANSSTISFFSALGIGLAILGYAYNHYKAR
nr:hypothetical protein [uncultured Undibacterium sp.]